MRWAEFDLSRLLVSRGAAAATFEERSHVLAFAFDERGKGGLARHAGRAADRGLFSTRVAPRLEELLQGLNPEEETGIATMKVQFLGSGDAFGSGGRFNTCFLIETTGGSFLVDCGASSLIAMRRFGVDPNHIHTVFVSHLHGDHFGGLPFLLLDAQFYSRRATPLTLVGPPGFRERLGQAMEVFFPGSSRVGRKFSTEIREINADQTSTINGVTVTPFVVEHACGAPPFALRLTCEGKVLAYSGDTEWTEKLLTVGRDADLLIVEALFFDRKVKYHLDYATLKANIERIGARRVVLTHMGPQMLGQLAQVPEEVAEDGKVIQL